MLIVDCATSSTLQELKTNKSSGVYSYDETDNFQSVTCNRYIVWRTCDDILELSEHSLNKNLIDSVLKIQFKNTLILPSGVSIHETADRIYVLVTTLVSAHRFAFTHPNKLLTNPSGISAAYSIFHHVPVDNSAGNSCQLPSAGSGGVGTTSLGSSSSSPAFLASCSWINKHLEAYFVVSKNSGSLQVIKLPPPFSPSSSSSVSGGDIAELLPKVHTIDLKQNSFIGSAMSLITGFVPAFKSTSSGEEAAISLLSYSTADDDLIYALCRDGHIRVLSLRRQEVLIVHSLLGNQQLLQAQMHGGGGGGGSSGSGSGSSSARDVGSSSSSGSAFQSGHSRRKPTAMKLWWHDDDDTDTGSPLPNLVVYLSGGRHRSFYFFETIIRQTNSSSSSSSSSSNHHHHQSLSSSYSATHTVAHHQTAPHLKFLLEVVAGDEQELVDYLVAGNQLWALWQANDTFSLQYYSIEESYASQGTIGSGNNGGSVHPPLEWMPVLANVNAPPEMDARCSSDNSREYFLREIFWRGSFSLTAIAKAIAVSNRVSIEEFGEQEDGGGKAGGGGSILSPSNLKIDTLMRDAINLVDGLIRSQMDHLQSSNSGGANGGDGIANVEFTVEQYTELEYKAWDDLYAFVLGYHLEESRPLSIFADVKTGAKGIVRQGRVEFIPALEPFDELIDYYFLLCRDPSPNQSLDLINDPALDYRLNTLMAKLERRMRSPVSAGLLQQSIRELLAAMSVISRSLSEDDLLNFAALMSRISSFSSKTQQTLSDIAKLIAEDHLLPEMSGLAEGGVGGGLGSSGGQDSSSIDDFFSRCPMVAEAIAVLLAHLKFDFVAPDSAAAFPFNQSPHHHLLSMNNCEGCEEDSSEDSNDSGGGGVGVASSTAGGGSLLSTGGPHWKMAEALQSNINPLFISLLASRTGLNFVVGTVARVVAGRYRFCRDLFLFQYFLNKFRLNLRADCMTKITAIEADTIPNTTQLLFSLDYLNWAASTPMVNPGLWWSALTGGESQSSTSSNTTTTTTTIVTAASGAHSPPKSSLTTVKHHSMVPGGGGSSSIGGGSSAAALSALVENTELLSVLELREYIDLNRLGILSHSTTFYDAYPQCTVLHFFIAFSGGILTRRLLSYKLATQYGGDLGAILAGGGDDSESGAGSGGSDIWRLIVTSYLSSVGQLLWPLAEGQLKLAEFLLGVGQYDLLERLNQRLHWCMEQSFSRTFLKGVVSLVTGEGQKAIRHLEQALHGVDHEAFLAKIFAKRAARRAPEIRSFEPQSRGSETGGDDLLAKGAHSDCDGDEEEEEDVQPNARTVYRYYNKLIQLFKRYSSPDYVIQLVEVALITLSPETDPEVEEHHSSLQSTLFACYLQLGAVEQAYNAMMGNGDGEQRRICLRQFILALCEAGDTASLVSFNYQGLEEEFVGILESKARTSGAAVVAASRFYSGGGSSKFYHPHHHHQDAFSTASRPSMATTTNTHSSSFTTGADSSCYPSPTSASSSSPPHSQPINYHHILYSYFIQVHQYRRAAQAMYDYYRQLRLEGAANGSGSFGALGTSGGGGTGSTTDQQLELLQKQAEALLIARNCLKLVEPSASYVNKNGGGKRAETAGNQSASASLKRKYSIDQTAETSSSPPPDPTIDEEALWREYELVSARHRLLQRNAKEYAIAASLLSAEEAVTFCVDACLYEAALRLSTLFRLPLEPVFGGMASKYVQLLHGAYNHRRIDDDMVLALFEGAEMGGGGGAGGYGSASAYGSNAIDPLASPSLLQQPPTSATTINSVNIDLLDIFYENGSNVAKSSFISYSTLSVCDRMWHLVMHYLERYETAPASSSRLMRKVAEGLLSNGVMLPASLSKVYQKVNCPELIRLLMSYNFLAEATAVSLDYMNAFMGHGLEYFDIKHSLYPNCPPLCIPLHIFNCLLKILREESEESKLEQWQNRLATEDTAESIHGGGLGGGASSVDDYGLAEERIDYEELYKKLSQRKQKLQEAITNYSS